METEGTVLLLWGSISKKFCGGGWSISCGHLPEPFCLSLRLSQKWEFIIDKVLLLSDFAKVELIEQEILNENSNGGPGCCCCCCFCCC